MIEQEGCFFALCYWFVADIALGGESMRIVFLNSMEKNESGAITAGAKVWIGEDDGLWRMGWNEVTADGEDETLWYEGASWSEMLHIYRHRLVVKLGEGYRPVIEGIWGEREQLFGRGMMSQKLVCYSEIHENELLYTELSSWRRKKASALRKAPYLIASNRLLRLISVFCPKTMEELLELPGVGSAKAAEFGAELLEMTKDKEQPGNFPLNWVEHEVNEDLFRTWMYKQKEIKFKHEMEKFNLRRNVLESLAEGMNLEKLCTKAGIERREAIELLEQLEKEGYNTDALIQMELKDVSIEEQEKVWKAYEELGDSFLKPVLHKAYHQKAQEGTDLDMLYERLRLIRLLFRRGAGNEMISKAV
ncbi:HRDC domain protein [compost metagenome]